MSIAGIECCLEFITQHDSELVKGLMKIQLCEISHVVNAIQEFGDQRERIAVLDSHVVQCLVIYA